jgi:hypothetical protein
VRTAAFFLLMAILDYCVISSARKILLDFLRGNRQKEFQKGFSKPDFCQKATLSYVKHYIREPSFFRPFRFYSMAYYGYCTLLPCKWALCVLAAAGIMPLRVTVPVLCIYNLGWFTLFCWEAPGKRHSRYAGRKYRQ